MNNSTPLFTLILCLLLGQTNAQTTAWSHRYAIDSIMNDPKYKAEHPGFAVMVVQDGKIVYEAQRGMANIQRGLPIRSNTMFNIGSITKMFTAAAILLLEERGQLSLDDPIQKHLPELPDFGATITLRHLIAHTSGIPDHFEVGNMQGKYKDSFNNFDKVVKIVQDAPELSWPPGSDFAYCNTGYMLLALTVERISGMNYHTFLVKNIFEPLGMKHSNGHQMEADGLPDGTISYVFDKKKGTYKHLKPTPNATGATGVQTTLYDFYLWDQNFWKPRIGGPDFIKKMETTGTLNDGSPTQYGAGLLLKPYEGHRMVAHAGGWSSFLMEYRRFPDLGLSVMVASNNDFSNPFVLSDAICRKVLPQNVEEFEEKLINPYLPFPVHRLQGTYISQSNFIRKIKIDSVGLSVITSEKNALKLFFQSKNETGDSLILMDEKGDQMYFLLDPKVENVIGLQWAGGHYFGARRFYEKLKPINPNNSIYCGKYNNALRKQKLKVKQNRNGGLVLKPIFFMRYPLDPLGEGVFQVRGEAVIIRFTETEMVVGNDWANGLRLQKR